MVSLNCTEPKAVILRRTSVVLGLAATGLIAAAMAPRLPALAQESGPTEVLILNSGQRLHSRLVWQRPDGVQCHAVQRRARYARDDWFRYDDWFTGPGEYHVVELDAAGTPLAVSSIPLSGRELRGRLYMLREPVLLLESAADPGVRVVRRRGRSRCPSGDAGYGAALLCLNEWTLHNGTGHSVRLGIGESSWADAQVEQWHGEDGMWGESGMGTEGIDGAMDGRVRPAEELPAGARLPLGRPEPMPILPDWRVRIVVRLNEVEETHGRVHVIRRDVAIADVAPRT
jgi:hypothetical protein